MEKLIAFQNLAKLFKDNGHELYLVGGSVRDYLLFHELNDLDIVSDATPDEVKQFFSGEASYVFSSYGAIIIHYEGYRFDFTTLREEALYSDSRHPQQVNFVKDLSVDVKRRDFTINALYMDSSLNVIDYVGGMRDMNNKIIRMIGDPLKRITEDPLRILRAIRFSLLLNFEIEENLKEVIKENTSLLNNLKPQKVVEELKKIHADKDKIHEIFDEFNILYLLDMVN